MGKPGEHQWELKPGAYTYVDAPKVKGDPAFHRALKRLGDLHEQKSEEYDNANHYANIRRAAEILGTLHPCQ
jgi:hypothetical protein